MLRNSFRAILFRTMASPYLAPAVAVRRGKNLVVPRSAVLPARCLKCNEMASTPWRKKFYWHSQWLYLLILFPGILIYAIVAMIVRKQMELNLPLCDTHHADRKRYKMLAILMLVGFIPAGLLLGSIGSEALGWVTGIAMFVTGFVFYSLGQLGMRPLKIDEAGGEFRGACTAFLDGLAEQS